MSHSFTLDIIATGSSKDLLEDEVKPLIAEFLKLRGLELSAEKTKITRITEGFEFLGQHIRKYPPGILLIRPSKKSIKNLLTRVREITRNKSHVPPGVLIELLNPILKGWANYHQHVSSKQIFHKMDHVIFWTIWRWCRRRHPRKPRQWIKKKYFHAVGNRQWVFSGETEPRGKRRSIRLYHLAGTPIRRHIKIKGEANPYDSNWETYFERRLDAQTVASLKGLKMLLFLWKKQEGRCLVCHQKITKMTGWQTHHVIWRSHGGSDSANNLILLHPECHQEVHRPKSVVVKPRSIQGVEEGLSGVR